MKKWLEKNSERLINIRRHLHQYPEIGYKEFHTSDYLKNILKEAGYVIGEWEQMGTGFYTDFGHADKPVLGIRSDLDALPIQDMKSVVYRSKNEGVMHACGHDVHMSIVTGFALWLKNTRVSLNGRIRFLYQPAEEQAPGGALKVIKAGAINQISHLIGLHVLPSLAANKIGIRFGTMSAKVQLLEFILNGPGGHTSRPQDTVNLISAASMLIRSYERMIKKYSHKKSPVVLSFGQISGGDTFNVIPSIISLKGTLRYTNSEIETDLTREINETVEKVSQDTGAQIVLKIPYTVPMIHNDSELTRLVINGARDILGEQNIVLLKQSSMGSDDFGFYTQKIPCTFIRIGSAYENVKDLHVPNFDVDERCLHTGLLTLYSIITKYFQNGFIPRI